MAMNREQKRMMQKQGQVGADGAPIAQPKNQPRPGRSPKEPRTSPVQFTREVRGELRKVAWPTREEVVRFSIIVLITLIVMTTMIALLDYAFGESIFWVIER
ncbi:MAG: preprotein translocase subunit SecE [Acidimicrobiales bacterium]|nr:preprotein translocase subunit SecE [Acidimicrobiales bacterium]